MTKYGIGKLDFWFKVDYCFPICLTMALYTLYYLDNG